MRTIKITFATLMLSMAIIGAFQAYKYANMTGAISDSSIRKIKIEQLDMSTVLNYSEIYDSVRFVKLESLPNVIVGQVRKVYMIENGDFLIYDNQGSSVFLFDNNGRFLNLIGQKGNGPGEYMTPEDVVYDEYNKEVIVWDYNKKNLMFFKLNGSFIKSVKLNEYIGAFQVMDKKRIALYLNNGIDVKDYATQSYNIKIIDRNGTLLDQIFPYSKKMEDFHPPCKDVFPVYNNRILCKPLYSQVVYELDSCNLNPKYILDFGENTIHPSMYEDKSSNEFSQILRESPGKVFCSRATAPKYTTIIILSLHHENINS